MASQTGWDALRSRLALRYLFEGLSFDVEEIEAHDHCHRTGRVRGILCRECNLLLGHARDDTNVLKAAIDYLDRRREGRIDGAEYLD